MENLTLNEISLAVAFIVALWKGLDFIIAKAKQPINNQQEQLDIIMKMTFALLEHQVTGDHINDMEKLYNETKDYLLKH